MPGVWDLVCFTREQRADVERQLAPLGIQVLSRSSSKLRVRFDGDPAVLRDLVGVKLAGAARAAGAARQVDVVFHGLALAATGSPAGVDGGSATHASGSAGVVSPVGG